MTKYIKPIIVILSLSFLAVLHNFCSAGEPQKPEVHRALDSEKEARIAEVMVLPAKEAFKQLKSTDFILDEDLLYRAIFKAFRHRKTDGVNLALHYLTLPQREMKDGKLIDRTEEHFVAKKILSIETIIIEGTSHLDFIIPITLYPTFIFSKPIPDIISIPWTTK